MTINKIDMFILRCKKNKKEPERVFSYRPIFITLRPKGDDQSLTCGHAFKSSQRRDHELSTSLSIFGSFFFLSAQRYADLW